MSDADLEDTAGGCGGIESAGSDLKAGPVAAQASGIAMKALQKLALLFSKAPADALHIGQVDADELPAVLGVQTSEWAAHAVPATKDIPSDFLFQQHALPRAVMGRRLQQVARWQ